MKKGFTLTELLLALSIVGVLAVLTVPILMNNIHNKMFASQVKNMAATIEQLAQDELISKRTRDLSDTDFSDPDLLLSDKHFSIVKSCSKDEALVKCWKKTGTDKVKYKNLNGGSISVTVQGRTVILKNGVMLRYTTGSSNSIIGKFLMDINGNEKPNIAGRDLLGFYITNKGHIVDKSYAEGLDENLETKITKCKTDVWNCYGALASNNWKMDY